MIRYTGIASTNIEQQFRVLKHAPYQGVTLTNNLLSSFGLDANPYPGIKGAVTPATTHGRGAVMGFLNKYNAACPGERRTYSTNPDGSAQVSEIYQLNDGSILIRGGISEGAEKYAMLIDPDGNITESFGLKTLTGDVVINGSLTVNGDITGDTVKTGDDIDLGTHVHGYLNVTTPSITDPPS
jgi:hypothetical protein